MTNEILVLHLVLQTVFLILLKNVANIFDNLIFKHTSFLLKAKDIIMQFIFIVTKSTNSMNDAKVEQERVNVVIGLMRCHLNLFDRPIEFTDESVDLDATLIDLSTFEVLILLNTMNHGLDVRLDAP